MVSTLTRFIKTVTKTFNINMKKYLIYVLTADFYELVKQTIEKSVNDIPLDYKADFAAEALLKLRVLWLNNKWDDVTAEFREEFQSLRVPKHRQILVEDTGNRTIGNSVVVLLDGKEQSIKELPIFNYIEWTPEIENRLKHAGAEAQLPENFTF